MGDERHVLAILHGLTGEHAPTAGARGHHILVVPEDGQCLTGNGAGSNVDDAGHELASDLVHVWDHEQQSLGGRKGCAETARCHASVQRSGCTGLRLELLHVQLAAEDVLDPSHRPSLTDLGHGRGRGDGEDEGVLGHGVGNMRGGRAPVPCAYFLLCLWLVQKLRAVRVRQRGDAAQAQRARKEARLSSSVLVPCLRLQELLHLRIVAALRGLLVLKARASLSELGKVLGRGSNLCIDLLGTGVPLLQERTCGTQCPELLLENTWACPRVEQHGSHSGSSVH
mmetsp:Transcript_45432/g.141125  ORF Transcript_45432/g.141125 Transcript_45432/m.141125 type:complete len:283 (+) Transcript_45432:4426-5274(+)